jgi:hypothetical protein
MAESPSTKIRFLGSLAGLVVGAVLGTLIGMGFNNILFGAAIGGCIVLIGVLLPKRGSLYLRWPNRHPLRYR